MGANLLLCDKDWARRQGERQERMLHPRDPDLESMDWLDSETAFRRMLESTERSSSLDRMN